MLQCVRPHDAEDFVRKHISLLLTFSVGDHSTCTGVFELLEQGFLSDPDFIRAERQFGNALSDCELTCNLNGINFNHSY